jgi:hypothetical protein
MIITSTMRVSNPPNLTLKDKMVKLDFGEIVAEITLFEFRNLVASLLVQGAELGIDFTTA